MKAALRRLLFNASCVLLFILAASLLTGCSAFGYSNGDREVFMDDCLDDYTDEECDCAWDYIKEHVDHDDYERYDDPYEDLPSGVADDIFWECFF